MGKRVRNEFFVRLNQLESGFDHAFDYGFSAVLNRLVFDAVFWRHLNVSKIKKDEYGVRFNYL